MKRNVELLLNNMKDKGMDAYIVPSTDAHMSEYVAEHWKGRAWVSGFTGSAGMVVISKEGNGLWTDGRYFIQAEKQLENSGITLYRMGEKGVPTVTEWLNKNLKEGSVIGFNGESTSLLFKRKIEKECKSKEFKLIPHFDLINEIWEDRPEIPKTPVFLLDKKYAGIGCRDKIGLVRDEMEKKDVHNYILASLDDIAWLFNIRGGDVNNNPVTISYAVITKDKSYLFIDRSKLSGEVLEYLKANNIEVREYDEIFKVIGEFNNGEGVYISPSRLNTKVFMSIPNGCKLKEGRDITTDLKAIKNETELENLRNCHRRDSAAMVNFLHWIDKNVGKEEITEISADEKLLEFRKQQDLFIGRSFDSIAGYKDHAAMMHYKATETSKYKLEERGLFLIDSGGQYMDGTTDITRTIVLGELTDEEKFHFTLVAKGHLALNNLKFLYGSTGSKLEMVARYPLWQHGIDYKCGTGHGVGFLLNVHEGPHGFSMRPNNVPFERGMILTNEPGVYMEGKHGIRTENTMIVQEWKNTESGRFLEFEVISLVPIDLRGIDKNLLSGEEVQWLNDYHKKVYDNIAPLVDEEVREWLKEATKAI